MRPSLRLSLPDTLQVAVNGKVVHSKRAGDGFVDSDAKAQKIFAVVEAELKAAGLA